MGMADLALALGQNGRLRFSDLPPAPKLRIGASVAQVTRTELCENRTFRTNAQSNAPCGSGCSQLA
jgi:hypothetical protein